MGDPQVNSAARIQHFSIRQDLADKYGYDNIQDYDTLEKYFYDVKQKESGVTPFGLSSSGSWQFAIPSPTGLFNQASWVDRARCRSCSQAPAFSSSSQRTPPRTGSSKPIPFWEDEGVIAAFRTIRKYQNDGILNADGLNADTATIQSQFQSGKFAGIWAITDGTASNQLVGLKKAIPNAQLAEVLPFGGDLTSVKPNQSFQADNLVVVNANGGDVNRALALQDGCP